MTYTDSVRREPKPASYVEYRHGKRFLHVKGPLKEARELADIALSSNVGSAMIEDFVYPTTGQAEYIIQLGEET